MSGPSPTDKTLRRPALVYIGSSENAFHGAGRVLDLTGVRTLRFGRAQGPYVETDRTHGGATLLVGVPAPWVSNPHAEAHLSASGSEFELIDLGSRNGTYCGPTRLRSATVLPFGTHFEMGRTFWGIRSDAICDAAESLPFRLGPLATSHIPLAETYARLAGAVVDGAPIVLLGETGVGKTALSDAIHELSGARGKLVRVSAGVMDPDALAQKLSGTSQQPGAFEKANGGTLVIEEVDQLTSEVQDILIGWLTTGQVVRVGETVPRRVQTRLVLTALASCAQRLRLRPELAALLLGRDYVLPPLRDRLEDLGLLCRQLRSEGSGPGVEVSARGFRMMLKHTWPFNIRELAQTLSGAGLLAGPGGRIGTRIVEQILSRRAEMPDGTTGVQTLRIRLMKSLAACNGDAGRVAEQIGVDAKSVHLWIERFELHAWARDRRGRGAEVTDTT